MSTGFSKSALQFKDEIRIVFVVQQFDQTREFYENILGLRILDEWNRDENDRGVVYALHHTQLEILKGDVEPAAQGFYVYIEIEDADALWERIAKTATIIDPIATQPWGHRNFSIKDPNGFKLKFFSKI